jgi:Holliday junction resolvasome RuvABC DNA-binding subunit
VGDETLLHTNLVVREDALSLFGFAERDELDTFTLLLSVSGVGPKSALGVLSALSVAQIAEAVATRTTRRSGASRDRPEDGEAHRRAARRQASR